VSRIKLELPEKFEFSTKILIRITDINYGNHLGNDALLSLIHEARVRYLNKIGLSEKNIGGYGIIMVDSVIVYKSEIFYGDELVFEVSVENMSGSGCDFYYKIMSQKNGKEAATAKTGIVFYDYNNKKITNAPNIFIEKVAELKSIRNQ
jgi:acyl-CoA thioesterase FadM